jgi:hypothetical protein
MKRQAVEMFAMLALLVMVVATLVHAQTAATYKIPFNFEIAGKLFPAGEYTVGRINPNSPAAVLIQDVKQSASLVATTVPIGGGNVQDKSRLVFNQYGNQYFLSQIWAPQSSIGAQFLRSKAEEKLALGLQQANGAKKAETVIVTAQPTKGGALGTRSKK